jgi:phosphatidylserine decarboxylase
MKPSLSHRLKVWPQYLLPKQWLTSVAWWLSNIRWRPFKNTFIRVFCYFFPVDLSETPNPKINDFEHFNAFFTRPLRADCRPKACAVLTSPADGRISQLGQLAGPDADQMIQAKGLSYTLSELVGSADQLDAYRGGQWITIYLAPYNYHRVHSPCDGQLVRATRLGGELFSVSEKTALAIPKLYARNERLVCHFEHSLGPVLVIMVAALMVAGIETVWSPPELRRPHHPMAGDEQPNLAFTQGQEMGRFHWGSTVIVVTPPQFPRWHQHLSLGQVIQLNQALTPS